MVMASQDYFDIQRSDGIGHLVSIVHVAILQGIMGYQYHRLLRPCLVSSCLSHEISCGATWPIGHTHHRTRIKS